MILIVIALWGSLMSDSLLKVDLLCPDRAVWSGQASSLRAPGEGGSFWVLPRHIGLVAALGTGALSVEGPEGKRRFAVSGGFLEVKKEGSATRISVLSDSAEDAGEIDVTRAGASKKRAQERLASRTKDLDLPRAQAALARALNRLRLAGPSPF